jgi:hypothetical protein
MKKLTALAGVAALGLSGQAFGYSASGTVTFSWGGNYGGTADPASVYGATSDTTADIAWTSNGTSSLSAMSDSTYFSAQSGYNSRSFYNADFATAAQCTAGSTVVPDPYATAITRRKYGCRFTSYGGTPTFNASPVADAAAATTGASATGSITVTDTTLTGTLTLNSTTDEPTGATTTFSPTGARLSNSAGDGFNGYNYRSADGSPFGNYWQGITTAGTLVLSLTGTFTNSLWSITGGTVFFSDSGFGCQQGGLGSTSDSAAGTLCTRSGVAGGQQYNGAHLSWGVDVDGASTGTTAITEIEVRSAVSGPIIETLSGVLASVSVSGGTLSTTSGEFRRALGSAGGGCSTYIVYDGTRVSCGTLTTGRLDISGTVTESSEIPVPAAVWLMGSALGLLGWIRRKASA